MSERNAVELFEKTILDKYLHRIFLDQKVREVIKNTIMDFAGKKDEVKNDEIERFQTTPLGYLIWKLSSLGGSVPEERHKYIKASDTITNLKEPQKNLLRKIMSLAFFIYQNPDHDFNINVREQFLKKTRNIETFAFILFPPPPPPLPPRPPRARARAPLSPRPPRALPPPFETIHADGKKIRGQIKLENEINLLMDNKNISKEEASQIATINARIKKLGREGGRSTTRRHKKRRRRRTHKRHTKGRRKHTKGRRRHTKKHTKKHRKRRVTRRR